MTPPRPRPYLATDIDLTQAGIAWRDAARRPGGGPARAALLDFFGAARRVFTTPPRIDQERLLTYDRGGRLSRAVIAISGRTGIVPVSVSYLEQCGIRTAADFVGAQVNYLPRRTAYVIRRDGTPLQIRGLGPDRGAQPFRLAPADRRRPGRRSSADRLAFDRCGMTPETIGRAGAELRVSQAAQSGVAAAGRDQLGVRALLDDPAVLEHETRSAAAAWVSRCATTSVVRPRVAAAADCLEVPGARAARLGGGLVEDRDRRVAQHQPGQRQLLRLGRGQLVAAFADHGVEAVGQRAHPVAARRRCPAPPPPRRRWRPAGPAAGPRSAARRRRASPG